MPNTQPDLQAYAGLLIYEMKELLHTAKWVVQQPWAFSTPADQTLRNAILEAHLIHARCMLEFLTNRHGNNRQIIASHFAPGWRAPNHSHLDDLYKRISTHLAHLSKHRLTSVEPQRWRPADVVQAIATAMEDMSQHLKGAAAAIRPELDDLVVWTRFFRKELREHGFGQLETSTSPSPGGSVIILGTTGGPPSG